MSFTYCDGDKSLLIVTVVTVSETETETYIFFKDRQLSKPRFQEP